ncbi:hypothetical protein HPP92_018375 [Vanilla planifolia]|uniref:Uncharacterized protein n=1 Tax=Vanilla planifolia TaxID=51239 RepID=A0A835QJW0_VANPL|nr:hypothetical protein HPP92_018375 [Vanilla planifolia]
MEELVGGYSLLPHCRPGIQRATFAAVGFAAGLAGTAISNWLISLRRRMDPSFEPPTSPPPTLLNAATWAVHMGVSSNLQYQTLNGVEFLLARALPPALFKVSVVALRCLNNVLGGMTFVMLAKMTGSQKVEEKANESPPGGGGGGVRVGGAVQQLRLWKLRAGRRRSGGRRVPHRTLSKPAAAVDGVAADARRVVLPALYLYGPLSPSWCSCWIGTWRVVWVQAGDPASPPTGTRWWVLMWVKREEKQNDDEEDGIKFLVENAKEVIV